MRRGLVALALAGAIAAAPGPAQAATVTGYPPATDELDNMPYDGYIAVSDDAAEDNDIEVFATTHRVTIVEHGRPRLRAGKNCHRRSAHEVFCRARHRGDGVYVTIGGGDDRVRGHCRGLSMDVYGGPGRDRLVQGGCWGSLFGGAGNDVLLGDAGGQQLRGGGGNDRLIGRGGDDILYGDGSAKRPGDDLIDGGGGRDTAAWDERSHDIRADLRSGKEQSPEDRDTLRGIENLVGGTGDDVLAGDGHANRLLGAQGSDELIGRGGDDILNGGTDALMYQEGDDDDPDHFSCGGGRDLIAWPGHTVLPWGCDQMSDDYRLFSSDPIRVRPRPVGAHAVKVPVVCDDTSPACRRRVTITSRDGVVLGRTDLVSNPPAEMRVELKRAAPRGADVTIVVSGDDENSDVLSEGELVPYRFKWRVGCDGAPRRDVCSLGAGAR